jgi:argininosuccinate lyase
MTGMVATIRFSPETMKAAAGKGFSTATDLADWLVRELGLPFREAHHVTGRIVALADGAGVQLADLALADMQKVHSGITKDVFNVLTVEASASSRTSYGGTSPVRVAEQVAQWTQRLRLE